MKLILTPGGGAELKDGREVVWTSADDESFRDEFPDEMLTEDDVPSLLDYLVEEDYLTDHDAERCTIEELSLNGDDEDDDEDDDDDDDEPEDVRSRQSKRRRENK